MHIHTYRIDVDYSVDVTEKNQNKKWIFYFLVFSVAKTTERNVSNISLRMLNIWPPGIRSSEGYF